MRNKWVFVAGLMLTIAAGYANYFDVKETRAYNEYDKKYQISDARYKIRHSTATNICQPLQPLWNNVYEESFFHYQSSLTICDNHYQPIATGTNQGREIVIHGKKILYDDIVIIVNGKIIYTTKNLINPEATGQSRYLLLGVAEIQYKIENTTNLVVFERLVQKNMLSGKNSKKPVNLFYQLIFISRDGKYEAERFNFKDRLTPLYRVRIISNVTPFMFGWYHDEAYMPDLIVPILFPWFTQLLGASMMLIALLHRAEKKMLMK